MSRNNSTNLLIKLLVVLGDFILLNAIIYFLVRWRMLDVGWGDDNFGIYLLINNFALLFSEFFFSTIIHLRMVGAGDIFRRILSLTVTEVLIAYIMLRVFGFPMHIGWFQLYIGIIYLFMLLLLRIAERFSVRLYREAGRNTRTVTFVGSDPELMNIYYKMKTDPTLGYSVLGYYSNDEMGAFTHSYGGIIKQETTENENEVISPLEQLLKVREKQLGPIEKLGTMEDFVNNMNTPENLVLGDELYLCISRKDKRIIRRVSQMCDKNMIRFYYVPVSVESIGLTLKREMLDDIEVFTTYDNPLQSVINQIIKRIFDVLLSIIFLIPTAILFPFIFIIVKIQSPGPIFFKQRRTGLDGKEFEMIKFRSMHVNDDADKVQATKDDPRKFPFGNFMRKFNIDELPQFINVLKGDMSIVGPRPHMLAHTEMYSSLIDKYMVRHFVKPGVTGWAQVTGFRGETKELWQMEGRVKRDIWYIEHWSIWLDLRIIWMTVKRTFDHDEEAY